MHVPTNVQVRHNLAFPYLFFQSLLKTSTKRKAAKKKKRAAEKAVAEATGAAPEAVPIATEQ